MRIWLLTIGEPIPDDGENQRLLRTGQFGEWLAQAGHDVTFFNSSFDHLRRVQRVDQTTSLTSAAGMKIILLHARAYGRSVSPNRILSHRDVARSFKT